MRQSSLFFSEHMRVAMFFLSCSSCSCRFSSSVSSFSADFQSSPSGCAGCSPLAWRKTGQSFSSSEVLQGSLVSFPLLRSYGVPKTVFIFWGPTGFLRLTDHLAQNSRTFLRKYNIHSPHQTFSLLYKGFYSWQIKWNLDYQLHCSGRSIWSPPTQIATAESFPQVDIHIWPLPTYKQPNSSHTSVKPFSTRSTA